MNPYFKNNEIEYKTVELMERYGGSFVQQLAVLYQRGDSFNRIRLTSTFDDYFKEYHPDNWPHHVWGKRI